MSWAQRLKHVFRINIEVCEHYGGKVKIIAAIEYPLVIGKILQHAGQKWDREPGRKPRQGDWLQHERGPPMLH